mmetsp:Transcript_10871/g.33331  ORF Transcript_10871/g.33331 Transcript_10871/m.33331 type:complete len:278 (+) Transcript_10871:1016-1849(+)
MLRPSGCSSDAGLKTPLPSSPSLSLAVPHPPVYQSVCAASSAASPEWSPPLHPRHPQHRRDVFASRPASSGLLRGKIRRICRMMIPSETLVEPYPLLHRCRHPAPLLHLLRRGKFSPQHPAAHSSQERTPFRPASGIRPRAPHALFRVLPHPHLRHPPPHHQDCCRRRHHFRPRLLHQQIPTAPHPGPDHLQNYPHCCRHRSPRRFPRRWLHLPGHLSCGIRPPPHYIQSFGRSPPPFLAPGARLASAPPSAGTLRVAYFAAAAPPRRTPTQIPAPN